LSFTLSSRFGLRRRKSKSTVHFLEGFFSIASKRFAQEKALQSRPMFQVCFEKDADDIYAAVAFTVAT
jgi:hypothetical protein